MSWPRLHPEAAEELQGSLEWTQARSADAAASLFAAFDAVLGRVHEAPHQFPLWSFAPSVRRAVLTQHPYVVYFVGDEPAEVVVLAFAHTRRDPSYWRDRAP